MYITKTRLEQKHSWALGITYPNWAFVQQTPVRLVQYALFGVRMWSIISIVYTVWLPV